MAQPVQKKTKCERTFLFTPVSLIEGNPWQEIDEGSDAALDTCMRQDRHSKVACDTATKGTMVKVAGLPPHMITPKFTKPARLEKELAIVWDPHALKTLETPSQRPFTQSAAVLLCLLRNRI